MLFNSVEYFLFLAVVVPAYFLLPHRFRWSMLLAASYWFYGAWRVDYLILLLVSTAIDYVCGLGLGSAKSVAARRFYLLVSLSGNLAILGYFKYRLFFGEAFGISPPTGVADGGFWTDFVLPAGLSFYTLQSMGYTIDVYRRIRPPERHPGYFALYVAYFPQLIAGPIERSTQLLPQLHEPKIWDWDRVRAGALLILTGLFKKLVIVGHLGPFLLPVFTSPEDVTPGAAAVAAYLAMIHLYFDFSAYTDMARGSAQIMGVKLTENFRRPFGALSVRDFWRRWHMSLSRWAFDYLHRPLARRSRRRTWQYLALLLTFTIIGLWHGPSWNFVLFGVYHGAVAVLEALCERHGLTWPSGRTWDLARLVRTHLLLSLSGILFFSPDLRVAWGVLQQAALTVTVGPGSLSFLTEWSFVIALTGIGTFLVARRILGSEDAGLRVLGWRTPFRWSAYYALCFIIAVAGASQSDAFIYFQF